MNRRSFFRRLTATLVAAAAAPVILREVISRQLPAAQSFWTQTTRVATYYDEEYEKALARTLTEARPCYPAAADFETMFRQLE